MFKCFHHVSMLKIRWCPWTPPFQLILASDYTGPAWIRLSGSSEYPSWVCSHRGQLPRCRRNNAFSSATPLVAFPWAARPFVTPMNIQLNKHLEGSNLTNLLHDYIYQCSKDILTPIGMFTRKTPKFHVSESCRHTPPAAQYHPQCHLVRRWQIHDTTGGHRRLAVERLDVAQSDEFHVACKLTSASAFHPSIRIYQHQYTQALQLTLSFHSACDSWRFRRYSSYQNLLWRIVARAPPKQSNGQKPPTHGSRSVLDLADSGMTGIDWFEVMQRSDMWRNN